MDNKEKFRISIIDFMVDYEKHEVGLDKNGDHLYLGDLVEYYLEKDYFVVYRYGEIHIKQVGTMHTIKTDLSKLEKVKNTFGSGQDWLCIGYKSESLYEKVKHLINE